MATQEQMEALLVRMRGMSAADLSVLDASAHTPDSNMTTSPGQPERRAVVRDGGTRMDEQERGCNRSSGRHSLYHDGLFHSSRRPRTHIELVGEFVKRVAEVGGLHLREASAPDAKRVRVEKDRGEAAAQEWLIRNDQTKR